MSIGNANFHPSAIEDKIYEILDSDPEYIVSSEAYTKKAIDAVLAYLSGLNTQWSFIDDTHPDAEGGSVSICWIEDCHLHHIVLTHRSCYEVC